MLLEISTNDQNIIATGFILAAIATLFIFCIINKRKAAKRVPKGWDVL